MSVEDKRLGEDLIYRARLLEFGAHAGLRAGEFITIRELEIIRETLGQAIEYRRQAAARPKTR